MDTSDRIYAEVVAENANVWYYSGENTNKIIVKLPSNTIKSLIKGCRVEFLFGRDSMYNQNFFHNGIRIYDDPVNFITVTGTLRFKEEHESLFKILQLSTVQVDFYNELSFPVASAFVSFKEESRKSVINFQKNVDALYIGDFNHAAASSLNCFDYTLDKTRNYENVYEIEILKVEGDFSNWNTINLHFVGFKEGNVITIDDTNEGGLLEKQVWAALDNVFHFDLHKNPVIKKGKVEREFIDILAYHDLGVFLVESKALGIIASDADKSMDKKVSTLKKHIRKAIKQLVGAKRNLDKGVEVHDTKGQLIKFKRNIIPHCIVLVSELLPFGDWTDILLETHKTMESEQIYLHVIGFSEFINFLKASRGRKEYFDYLLMQRAESIVKAKTLLVNSIFVKE